MSTDEELREMMAARLLGAGWPAIGAAYGHTIDAAQRITMQYVDDVLFQKSPKGSLVDLTRIIEFIQEWDDRRTNSIEALQKVKNYLLDKGYMGGDNHGWGGKKPIDAVRDFKQKAYQDRNRGTGLPDPRLTPGFDRLSPENQTELKKMFGIEEEDR